MRARAVRETGWSDIAAESSGIGVEQKRQQIGGGGGNGTKEIAVHVHVRVHVLVHFFKRKECAPGITLATLASLTAAACGALTGFVRSRPVVPGARLKLTQTGVQVNVRRTGFLPTHAHRETRNHSCDRYQSGGQRKLSETKIP